MNRVIVVGAGASGLMAALTAAQAGAQVLLLEKNEKPGKKIYITGKGRCNLTNACGRDEFAAHIVRNPRFMYSSLRAFDSEDMMALLSEAGLRLKTERGCRVFPASDHASDVTKTLTELARANGAQIRLNTAVTGLVIDDGACRGVKAAGEVLTADAVVVATGGLSYPATGSTGDGYAWARTAGHTVEPLYPSLVPIEADLPDGDISQLAGLAPRNVTLTLTGGKKPVRSEVGELLFTHTGISGPLVLRLSALIAGADISGLGLELDWKPALDEASLDARILREFDAAKNRTVRNVFRTLLPESAVPAVLAQALVSPDLPVHEVTKAQRQALTAVLKRFRIVIKGLGGWESAVITRGGVSVREVDPATMQSKLVRGLFFTGEMLDVDAMTGGFNLQIAWSTGRAAGLAAASLS